MLSEDDRSSELENMTIPTEETGVSVSDLYRQFVMSESPKKGRAELIESFQNNNILKFSSKRESV
jgi:hypothetical protein